MALDGFMACDRSALAPAVEGVLRRRWNRAERSRFAALRRPPAPSRRCVHAHMAPATFVWLVGGWTAVLAVLAILVLLLRAFA